jgi:peptidoglycan/xylan/chitin deacetylase (PgdA/CDA1 family)
MDTATLLARLGGRWRRDLGNCFGRRPAEVSLPHPVVSFTFDDFPRSALSVGGAVLESYGVKGTYYVSLGLAGKMTPTGEICHLEDVEQAVQRGHELGCHTFDHCHAWDIRPNEFEQSILRNLDALSQIVPGAPCRTLAYPISNPSPGNKLRAGRHFVCCRGGGQTFNSVHVDLNNLRAFFLEQSRDHPDVIEQLVDRNADARGWLIFATHDVSQNPTRFGCSTALFERIVRYVVRSGVTILPVYQTWTSIKKKSCR